MSSYDLGFYIYGAGVAICDIGVGGEGGYIAVKYPNDLCALYCFMEFTTGILGGGYVTPTKPITTTYLPPALDGFFVKIEINQGIAGVGSSQLNIEIANEKNYPVFTMKEKMWELRGLTTGSIAVQGKLAKDSRFNEKPLTQVNYSRYREYAAGLAYEHAMGRGSLLNYTKK